MRSALGAKGLYVGLVGVIALGTVIGMVAMWPRGEAPALDFIEGTSLGETTPAKVVAVTSYECAEFATGSCQRATLELNGGPEEGSTVESELNTGGALPSFAVGDEVRVLKNVVPAGADPTQVSDYTIVDYERKSQLLWLTVIFAALVVLFGRWRGALSLVGLAISLVIVLAFIVPAILRDSPPLAVALVGSMAVMLTTIPLAHGLGPKSLAAMTGTAFSLALIVGLAVLFADLAHLTGFSSEEATTLAANDQGINFQSLLIAGMVVGSLGVLDDVTVSQASTVLALRVANPAQRFRELFRLAIDVGRDHVSATVNTLVLAYAGASLTVLLVFASGRLGVLDAINLEVIASVVIATLVGSIGLICAVPITTALAALLAEDIPAEELAADAHVGHAH
ncbi:MAG: YibE/F family protein [Solirubrobacterales bacterium]